jgi:DNA-binding transcriptional MerR regulator
MFGTTIIGLSLLSDMNKPQTQITFEFTEAAPTGIDVIEKDSQKKITILEKQIAAVNANIKTIAPAKRGRKSLKTSDENADNIHIPEDEILFQKQYYSIGDVAEMFFEKTSLIRYWETEFDILKPRKNRKGDRFFRPIDVKNLKLIYDLLRRRKMTIEGAKAYLKGNEKAEEKYQLIQSLEKIKGFLSEMKASL